MKVLAWPTVAAALVQGLGGCACNGRFTMSSPPAPRPADRPGRPAWWRPRPSSLRPPAGLQAGEPPGTGAAASPRPSGMSDLQPPAAGRRPPAASRRCCATSPGTTGTLAFAMAKLCPAVAVGARHGSTATCLAVSSGCADPPTLQTCSAGRARRCERRDAGGGILVEAVRPPSTSARARATRAAPAHRRLGLRRPAPAAEGSQPTSRDPSSRATCWRKCSRPAHSVEEERAPAHGQRGTLPRPPRRPPGTPTLGEAPGRLVAAFVLAFHHPLPVHHVVWISRTVSSRSATTPPSIRIPSSRSGAVDVDLRLQAP